MVFFQTKFKSYEIESTAQNILKQHLEDKTYDPEMCRNECQIIAAKISEALKAKNFKRYKHVVVVSIGSIKERPGVYLGSRCLWNDKTDSFATVRFQNTSLYAIAMIYGLYYEWARNRSPSITLSSVLGSRVRTVPDVIFRLLWACSLPRLR